MRRGYTAQAVRDAEAPHLAAGEPLMERAAHALAERIRQELLTIGAPAAAAGSDTPARLRVVLLVGSGSNGGDALFAGAELAGTVVVGAGEGRAGAGGAVVGGAVVGGAVVDVVAIGVGHGMHEGGRSAAQAAGVRVESPDPARAAELAVQADVVVDGILGTGTSAGAPALRGAAREVVSGILDLIDQDHDRPIVVAVDLPSGVDPDTGAIADDVVLPASVTVTFGGIKAGLLQGRGAELAGEIHLVEIGIEHELAAAEPSIVVD